ncbi:protein MSS51, putative [Coccidioides posadasii C735 delta SOWgp]|nr:protein MSS51, putative [Coccidioides posadasii C735 delta SOWgp]EER25796.1 protein MSS51, putative [Coccidioides posadasii C735 delta SOWgp]KMM69476.1 Mss51p [Coccidioides posadasii RMSCC 3488]|eukprot:XP_003067941.1 protein MSS51, putative [Coccidioides posadasii C735 delta SOWgp]
MFWADLRSAEYRRKEKVGEYRSITTRNNSMTMVVEFTCQRCAQALRLGIRSHVPTARMKSIPNTRSYHSNTIFSGRRKLQPSIKHGYVNVQDQIKGIASASRSQATDAPSSQIQTKRQASRSEFERPILRANNLFHSYTNSPSPEIRRRAAFIKQNAFCPHPNHRQTRIPQSPHDSESRKTSDATSQEPAPAQFECPDCGVPVYCCEEHWMDDFEAHLEVCETIRQINEDDHDLVSGRFFTEFDYPGRQDDDFVVNMTNWDTFLYTREFNAVNDDRCMRQVTRLLTYPVTIASVLHELSPYDIRNNGRLTTEGLKSLAALRYTLHPPKTGEGTDMSGLRLHAPPVRIFVLGARAESSLPRDVWLQLTYLFPRASINLIFIGPESMANRDDEFPLPERTPSNPFGGIVEDRLGPQLKITTYVDYFHTMHRTNMFQPYDPYFDCFMLFHPGLGHPASSHEWEETLPHLLETKVPILCTGYTEWDMQRDLNWVTEKCAGEFDILLEPGENRFRSLRWDLNDLDPHDVSAGNWGVWGFRGKRYEATLKD